MTQATIPFKEIEDIKTSHLYAFNVCNCANKYWSHKQAFYRFKSELLQKHGHQAGYDLQVIKKACYSCDGKGFYRKNAPCLSCAGTGTFSIKKVVLKRYLLNGELFHAPMGELLGNKLKPFAEISELKPFNEPFVKQVNGLIVHEAAPLNPSWAFYYLLWNYDRLLFFQHIYADIDTYNTRAKHKFKNILKNNATNPLKALANFFEVKDMHLEPIDDLPF
ncbi:MAG: hypothetical protein QG594_1779 [Bacteroidota bacterium]|nr:hypothetical protein [Bacteroidota bacterium]